MVSVFLSGLPICQPHRMCGICEQQGVEGVKRFDMTCRGGSAQGATGIMSNTRARKMRHAAQEVSV